MFFQTFALVLKDKSILDIAYIVQKHISRILMICQDIYQDHK